MVSSTSRMMPAAPEPAAASPIPLASLSATARRAIGEVRDLWVYAIPLNTRFRGVTCREGLLIRGEAGWGEAAPFAEYDAAEASLWLRAACDAASTAPPTPRRSHVAVNVTIPVVSPEAAVARVEASGGCATAKVKVADPRSTLAEDCARVEAVADALTRTVGAAARLRVDVNGAWDVDQAVSSVRALDRAAAGVGGLEYVEQPCATVEELAAVRRRVGVRVAADESIRRAHDPLRVVALDAADIAVIKVAPLGGIGRALEIAHDTGLDVVVSSAVETSVGIAMGVHACAALESTPYASGLATVQLLGGDVTSHSLVPRQGLIECRPVEPDVLGSLPGVADDRLQWWRNRVEAMALAMGAR